jgi:hypothetical protein
LVRFLSVDKLGQHDPFSSAKSANATNTNLGVGGMSRSKAHVIARILMLASQYLYDCEFYQSLNDLLAVKKTATEDKRPHPRKKGLQNGLNFRILCLPSG